MDCQFGLKSFQDWLGSCAMGLAATGVSAEQPGDGRGGDGLPPVCGGGNAVCHESKNRHEQASRSMISACVAGVPMPLACVLSSSNAAFNSSAFFVFMSSQRLACSIALSRVASVNRAGGLVSPL